jgi:hypothetical protein
LCRVLALCGDAGIGKKALLNGAAEQAPGIELGRVAVLQAEATIELAGLHQLLVPYLGGLDRLPDHNGEP